jgi:hypothetical protein
VGEAPQELPSQNLKVGRTLALPRALLISLLAVFFRRGALAAGQASPERVGEYRQTQVFYRGLWKSVKWDEVLEMENSSSGTRISYSIFPKT